MSDTCIFTWRDSGEVIAIIRMANAETMRAFFEAFPDSSKWDFRWVF